MNAERNAVWKPTVRSPAEKGLIIGLFDPKARDPIRVEREIEDFPRLVFLLRAPFLESNAESRQLVRRVSEDFQFVTMPGTALGLAVNTFFELGNKFFQFVRVCKR